MKHTFRFLGFFVFCVGLTLTASAQVFEDLTVVQCDSVINANYDNPDFVILDVRTSGEYIPQHLEDAINIDYYAADFSEQLDQLNKEKTYLIHCKSGGRSGVTFDLMQTLDFQEVYNMLGGMNAWNAESLPTTDAIAARLMFVSESYFPLDTIPLMTSDTLDLTITNRGNSLLTFEGLSSLAGTEFSSNFELGAALWGAEDYTFQIIYTPEDELLDSLIFVIESTVGSYWATIVRVGQELMVDVSKDPFPDTVEIYPNPVRNELFIDSDNLKGAFIGLYAANGQLVLESQAEEGLTSIDVSQIRAGVYFIRISQNGNMKSFKIAVNK